VTTDKLQRVHDEVSQHLEEISRLFTQRPKITIVIRTPWLEGGGVLLSDDDFDQAIAEIQRLRAVGIPTGAQTPEVAARPESNVI
jgi:hypothetical protein